MTKVLQTSALLLGATALVFSSAGTAGAAGDDAVVSATLDCGDLTVTSSKDISNLVVVVDGSEVKFDGLEGTTLEYTAEQLGGDATGVYVKSGSNSTDADTSTGEYVQLTDTGTECEGTGTGTVVDGDTDTDTDVDGDEVLDDDDDTDTDGDDGVPATVVLDCVEGELEVVTSKDLSNVKFFDAEGEMIEELEGLSGTENSFEIPEGAVKATAKSSTTENELVLTDADCEIPAGTDDTDTDTDTDTDGDGDEVLDDDDTDTDVDGDELDEDEVLEEGDRDETPVVEVEDEVVLNPVTPIVPVATPAAPAAPASPAVSPAVPATPAQTAVLPAAEANTQVLGSQVSRAPGQLARTGDSTANLIPFGIGLVLLGFGVQRSSKRLAAARVR